jgi:hypothetical protein
MALKWPNGKKFMYIPRELMHSIIMANDTGREVAHNFKVFPFQVRLFALTVTSALPTSGKGSK